MKLRVLAVALLLLACLCSADEFRVLPGLGTDNFHRISLGREADFFNSGLAFAARDDGALSIQAMPTRGRTIPFPNEDFLMVNANDRGRIFGWRMGSPLRRPRFTEASAGDSDSDDSHSMAAVPEPGTLALLGTGLSVLGGALRRRLGKGPRRKVCLIRQPLSRTANGL